MSYESLKTQLEQTEAQVKDLRQQLALLSVPVTVRAEWFRTSELRGGELKLFLYFNNQFEPFTSFTKEQATAVYNALRCHLYDTVEG